jgi:YHS domain-containing protein
MSNVKDPVCGMTVDSDKAADWTTCLGANYCFCSTECRRAFELHPERYLSTPVAEAASGREKGKRTKMAMRRFNGLEYDRAPRGNQPHQGR